MTISGKWVDRFADASHALPVGMHMNADYPFMLPRIVGYDGKRVTIEGAGGQRTDFIIKRGGPRECGFIRQSSSFERIMNRKPQKFTVLPFKDENTPVPAPTERRD